MKNETKMHTSLSDMPRKNAFEVPEGYFEELPTAVLLKCSVSKVEKQSFLASKPLWWSVAACSLLLLGIWFVVPNSTSSSNSLSAEQMLILDENDWTEYLAYYVCPTIIEDELFAENIDFTPSFEDFTDEELLDYDDFFAYFDHYDLYY
jgi:hypothetical protein